MFQIQPAEGKIADGSGDDHPLRLDGIARSDFLPLLKVMFPTEMDDRREMPSITVLVRQCNLVVLYPSLM
jgi:hypothetical protein